jgi:protein-S-isoprenylcysteine O-methyltransferase Ste14
VTGGPYRYPRYLGIIVFTTGISLVFRSWLALIWRIRDEEALMQRSFGKDWEAYSRRSWRLIPLVY